MEPLGEGAHRKYDKKVRVDLRPKGPFEYSRNERATRKFHRLADFYEGLHDKGAGNRTPLPLPISLLPASGVAAFGSSFRQEPSLNKRSVIFFRSPKPAPSSEGNYI